MSFAYYTMGGVVFDKNGFAVSAEIAEPAKPIPELPAEVWQDHPADSERAHAATLALCRGN